MIFKNKFIGATLALVLPFTAQAANLVTTNNTSEPSTVKVNGICVGSLQPPLKVVTPPHGQSIVAQDKVYRLCGSKTGTCTAYIHMTENCSDAPAATASFNLTNFALTSVSPMRAGYSFPFSGTSLTINPA